MPPVPAVSALVNGIDRSGYLLSFETESAINEHGVSTVTFLDRVGSWQPDVFDSVAITVDGISVLRGTILDVTVGWLAEADFVGVRSTCRVVDRTHILLRQMQNTIYPAGTTLRAILEDAVATLDDDWPITLHPDQDTGPTFATPITVAWSTWKEALDYLADVTGRVYRIDEEDRLRMWAIGALSAPTVFGDGRSVRGASWSRQAQQDYANAVYVQFGPTDVVTKTERQYGDGSRRTWDLRYAIHQGSPPSTVYDSAESAVKPVAAYPDASFEWTYEAATNRLHQRASDPVLGPSDYWEATYSPGFPQIILVSNAGERAARGIWVRMVELPDVTDRDEAQSYGEALNARSTVRPRRLEITTTVPGNEPGMVATVNLPQLGIASESYLIERSQASYIKTGTGYTHMEFRLSLIGGNVYAGSFADYWRSLRSRGGTGSGSISGGGGGGLASGSAIGVPLALEESASVVPGTAGSRVRNAARIPVDASKTSGSVTVRCRLRRVSGSGSLTPQLRRVSDGSVVGAGTATTSSAFVEQTFAATVTGVDQYELWVVASDATTEGIAVGTLVS